MYTPLPILRIIIAVNLAIAFGAPVAPPPEPAPTLLLGPADPGTIHFDLFGEDDEPGDGDG